jgi:hypothetical protein
MYFNKYTNLHYIVYIKENDDVAATAANKIKTRAINCTFDLKFILFDSVSYKNPKKTKNVWKLKRVPII